MKLSRLARMITPRSFITVTCAALMACAADPAPDASLQLGAPAPAVPAAKELPAGTGAAPATEADDDPGGALPAPQAPGSPEDPRDPTNPERPASPTAPLAVDLACGDAPLWWHHDVWSYGDTAPLFDFSPNGGLLVRGGVFSGSVLRVADGSVAGSIGRSVGQDTVAGWVQSAGPHLVDGAVEVVSLGTGEPLYQVTVPPMAAYTFGVAAISQGGERLVALSCGHEPGSETGDLRLTAWKPGVYTWADLLLDVPLGPTGHCILGQMTMQRDLRLLPDGSAALVSAGGALSLVDLTTGVITTAELGLGAPAVTEPPMAYLYTSRILSMAVSPDGALAAVVAEDGVLRLFSLPSLAPVGELAVPVGVANACTYIPTTDSPVAFSADGLLLAHMGEGGAIVVRQSADLAVVTTLAAPEGAGLCEGIVDHRTPQAIRFSPDGARLAVAYEDGVALWGCGPSTAPAPTTLTGELWGSTTLAAGEEGAWAALGWTSAGEAVTVKRWFIDDAPAGEPSLHGALRLAFPKPGAHTVRVELDDGLSTASASLTVVVEQAAAP